jgi:hypothetical protein
MALQTPPAATPDLTIGWWLSRYGAEEATMSKGLTPGSVLPDFTLPDEAGPG